MKTENIEKIIDAYCNIKNISKEKFELYPLYIHLDGFSHSIGFINHKAKAGIRESDYTSVGYSGNMSEYEENVWGYQNEHQKALAKTILSQYPHYLYQNNAQEILF